MTIIDFQSYKDSKDSQVSSEDKAVLRRNIQNMDRTDFLDPNYDPFREFTEEEKLEARKSYAAQMKEYRKKKRAYDFAKACYRQGLTDEYPAILIPPMLPIGAEEGGWKARLALSDEERAERDAKNQAIFDDIEAWAHVSVAAEKAAIEKAKSVRRALIQQIIAFHCPAQV